MVYIKTEADINGAHSEYQISSVPYEQLPEGWAEIPEGLLEKWESFRPYVKLSMENGLITDIEDDAEARAAAPVITDAPARLRERAYDSRELIQWPEDSGEYLTVSGAAKLWMYYLAEGNTATSAALSALIADAKAAIRAEYPDV
ncbi:MAG: hypothetical protein IJG63_01070 [Oscillospiraceae bacterium]|nr:hypothetical protein [Oscillospiraceae bacterium]